VLNLLFKYLRASVASPSNLELESWLGVDSSPTLPVGGDEVGVLNVFQKGGVFGADCEGFPVNQKRDW
jgi:hypothetical protein